MENEVKYNIIPEHIEESGDSAIKDFKLGNDGDGVEWIPKSVYFEKYPEKKDEKAETETEIKETETEVEVEPEKKEEVIIESNEEIKTDTFDFSVIGENFKSVDDVKTALSQKNELEAQLKTLQEEIEALKVKNPYEDDTDLAKLYLLKKESPEKAEFMKKLILGDMNEMDLHVAEYIKTHPNRKDNVSDIKELIQSKYEGYFDEDADVESKEYKLAKMQFEDDAQSIKSKYMDEFNSVKVNTPKSKEEIESEKTKIVDSWKPILSSAFEKDIVVPFQIPDEKGNKQKFDYTYKKEEVSMLKDKALERIKGLGIPLSKENLNAVYTSVLSEHTMANLPNILSAYGKSLSEKVKDSFAKKVNAIPDDEKATDKNMGKNEKPDAQDAWLANHNKNKKVGGFGMD